LEYINTIGKRFVAAIDRFHVHRALLATLQERYRLAACCVLLKGDPFELFIIPCHPLSNSFLEEMFQKIANAAHVIDFPPVSAEQLADSAYFDAPDEIAKYRIQEDVEGTQIGSVLNVPLTVENRIIGMLSLFDVVVGAFDTNLLKLTSMIADYAAVALENTRLRERETALWRQAEYERQRLELTINSMAEGLLITDAQGAIVSLNQFARCLLAQAKIDFQIGMQLREVAERSNVLWLHDLADIIEQGLMGKTAMNQELTASGRQEIVPLTLSISVAPLHDVSEKRILPIGVVAVLNDVTSIKQVEQLKDEFISVVSHELRTPLTTIKGYTQHLIRRLERRLRKARATQPEVMPPVAEMPENYDLRSLYVMQSQTEHLERLVSDLLDRSRMREKQFTLEYTTFCFADVLAESVRLVQASAEQHTISLVIQQQNTQVVADRTRVSQVIGNILDNAVRYSPQGGEIVVRLEEWEGDYLVSVMDQGIGVSPEHFDHIFERFYRVYNTASHEYAGIGLGLFVAKAIVDGHGGRIWLTNNQHGIGTTFHFTIPHRPRSKDNVS
jgi:two-component system phosphate regulon sensor histidine kinase PhoR